MTVDHLRKISLDSLKALLKPLVKFCLRNSCTIQDLYNAAKSVFLECAEEEMLRSTKKINVSRLSVLTGLHRKDVTKIFREKQTPGEEDASLLTRVVGQWQNDKRFVTRAGDPRVLSYQGEKNEFRELVNSVSQNINSGTVMFELKRRGIVSETRNGLRLMLQLLTVQSDPRAGYELLARDIEALIEAVDENLRVRPPVSNLHLRTEFDSIYPRDLSKIRQWFVKEGKSFHKRARKFLSKLDKDLNPSLKVPENEQPNCRVALGSFSITPPISRK